MRLIVQEFLSTSDLFHVLANCSMCMHDFFVAFSYA